jgi:protein-disulfide isomerase-like protein with CxxC motif
MSSTDRSVIVLALREEGISQDQAERLGSDELKAKAESLSLRAQAFMAKVGARGVPTVLAIDENHIKRVDHESLYGRAESFSANQISLITN